MKEKQEQVRKLDIQKPNMFQIRTQTSSNFRQLLSSEIHAQSGTIVPNPDAKLDRFRYRIFLWNGLAKR